jgi:hypothetical protein
VDTVVPDGLDIRELPLRPKAMLVEPFCRLLADTVTSCLRDVYQRTEDFAYDRRS